MKNQRWLQVVFALSWMVGCSDSGGSPEAAGTAGSFAAGGTDSSPSIPSDQPRPRRGEVTLLAAGPSAPAGTWTLSGPASGAEGDEATVSCTLTSSSAGARLEVDASAANTGVPSAALSLFLTSVAPVSTDIAYDGLGSSALSFEASLPGGYQYAFGGDENAVPPVKSSCNVVLSAISESHATGQVACRSLLATPRSADAPVGSAPAPRASATIAFDCPIVARSGTEPEPQGGSGGTPGAGGRDPGGAGSGGVPEPVKSCTGVAESCSSRTGGTCTTVKGCSRVGECSGFSSSCFAQFSSFGCYSLQGCVWSTLNKKCSGISWSCDLFDGSASCVSQNGCSWDYTCEGIATSCSSLGEFECNSQPGCTWK